MGVSKKIAIIGAEVEENLGIRYIMAALKEHGHDSKFIKFNQDNVARSVVEEVLEYNPDIVGLSMVFTLRARSFANLAALLRDAGYRGHITAGGHFASFNHEDLMIDFLCFDTICHGEGEWVLTELADKLDNYHSIPGLTYRSNRKVIHNPIEKTERPLNEYPWPQRSHEGHIFFGKPLRNMLSGRGCYGQCKFCSIRTWYNRIRMPLFRQREVDDVLKEMKYCYDEFETRIFNFHDDNFFLPTSKGNEERFGALREGFGKMGLDGIALSIKARPDNLNKKIISLLSDLHVIRVFIGIENMSDLALDNLGRNLTTGVNRESLELLNNSDIDVAFNLLIFEPKTTLKDLEFNLSFMEHHLENPYNFCRTEIYSGTPLEAELRERNKLRGDYFGWDYMIEDHRVESFFNAVNSIFHERNFSYDGIQTKAMWVDYFYHVAKFFYPGKLNRSLRAISKNYVKGVNLDNYQRMATIYDFIEKGLYEDEMRMRDFIMGEQYKIMNADRLFKAEAEHIINELENAVGVKSMNFM